MAKRVSAVAEPPAQGEECPRVNSHKSAEIEYLRGFGSYFESEAKKGALPVARNNPQRCPYGLYAEQLSGTAFTVPRLSNQRTWLYRIRPSVVIGEFKKNPDRAPGVCEPRVVTPERLRWTPREPPRLERRDFDFVSSLQVEAGQGDPADRDGMCIYTYCATVSMKRSTFCNSDGDFLIVPQHGTLRIVTEMGLLVVPPGHICVIQRGIRFQVSFNDSDFARGYICEVYEGHYELPDLGPIGANGLAAPRDFCHPVARFENVNERHEIVTKFQRKIFTATCAHSPFDVVAWHGNYVPYCYDLSRFCPVNSVLFDHMDPSIFTVLTCKSKQPGVALVDFVIFPPRWMTQEDTFRPPYFHRNCMTEYMGLIRGQYDAKTGGGFVPGGSSLHSIAAPHGPDLNAFEKASQAELSPQRISADDLAFMFETSKMLKVSDQILNSPRQDSDYIKCWQNMVCHFTE
mmetsp:Transcript_12753/g.39127  ORF Transcript_12753/g.39127 Transcript_12753/m.39127 type:complete len:459 (+) Transcript_12753:87-1463(+)